MYLPKTPCIIWKMKQQQQTFYMQRMMTVSSAHTIRFVFPVGPALQNTSSLSPAPPTQNWKEKQISSFTHTLTHSPPKLSSDGHGDRAHKNPTSKSVPNLWRRTQITQPPKQNRNCRSLKCPLPPSTINLTYSLPDPFFNPQVSFIAPGFLDTDNPTHTSPPNLLSISWSAGGVRNCARHAVQILRKSKGG